MIQRERYLHLHLLEEEKQENEDQPKEIEVSLIELKQQDQCVYFLPMHQLTFFSVSCKIKKITKTVSEFRQ